MKLSIIIPVHNVEPYVEKCLRSCTDQDIPLSDYEIIIVNDGSQDNSLAIVNRVSKEFSNIIVLSQKNAGLSTARNNGLSIATGEYVWFIDSDDRIKSNCLGRILNTIIKNQCDGLRILAVNIISGREKSRYNLSKLTENVYSGIDLLKSKFWEPCVPFTIYRREFLIINNLKFVEGIFHEDTEFSPRAYFFAKKIAVLSEIFYYVNFNPNSITRSVNNKRAFDYITVAKRLSDFSQIVPAYLMYIFNNQISVIINNSLYQSYQMNRLTAKNLNIALMENKSLFKHLRKSTIFKYRIEGILFSIFPRYCLHLYHFMKYINKNRPNKTPFGALIYCNLP